MSSNNTNTRGKNKKTRKAPSKNKYDTLKRKFDNKSKNINFRQPDLEFNITYGEENLEISYKLRGDNEYEILIKNIGQDTNCAIFSYNRKKKTIELESLLYEVADEDKCRFNKSGVYYIELILQIIKILQKYPEINFKPCIISLFDNAKKQMIPFGTKWNNKFSIYKLLMDGRTFYEAYGFFPYDNIDCLDTINYDKFETLISIRHNILNFSINNLEEYFKTLKPFDSSVNVLECIKSIIKQLLLIDIDLPNQSISAIFRNIIKNETPSDKDKNVCLDIYRFVNKYLGKILEGLNLVSDAQNFIYIITPDNTHYEHMNDIYFKYSIQRYDEYAKYLQILD